MNRFAPRLLLSILFLLAVLLPPGLSAQHEVDYSAAIARAMGGITEHPVQSGRVDVLTQDYAIEVEWASKWKNSIGQALWYGLQTNRSAGVVLVLRNPGDFKYLQQLTSALDHGGLSDRIKVWAYPDDFPDAVVQPRTAPVRSVGQAPGKTDFWLTTNSGKRHRKSCRWYENSQGRYAWPDEGEPAGCCH